MRTVDLSEISAAVRELSIEANRRLPRSLQQRISAAATEETSAVCQGIFQDMQENLKAATELQLPICQDTGTAVVFAEVGQDVHLVGTGDLLQAVTEGVRQGYTDGFLRKSMVSDPLRRQNTGDNTPVILHTELVTGDRVRLTVAPKGAGSENMSALKMMTPAASREDVMDFVVETVRTAGGNPCPPLVVGVGIGGNFEFAPYLAKKAVCRDIAIRNPDGDYAQMEAELLNRINQLGIGAQGFGGSVTALAVNIELLRRPYRVFAGCSQYRVPCDPS